MAQGEPGRGGLPRRRIGVLVAVAALALGADVVTKVVAVATLSGREPVGLLGGLLTLRLTRNSGAAFSIGTGMTWVFTLIAAAVAGYIVMKARELRSLPWAVTLGLILGGALGNLADRILRGPAPLHGHVVDWIELPNWPVFNLADSSIVCGGVLAVWLAFRGLNLDGTRTIDEPSKAGPPKHKPAADGSAKDGVPADGPAKDGVPADRASMGEAPADRPLRRGAAGDGLSERDGSSEGDGASDGDRASERCGGAAADADAGRSAG